MNLTGYKQIGKGSFSKVYKKDNDKHVIIKTNDPIKEAMAVHFPSSRLFPKIEYVDRDENYNEFYKMEFFPKVSSLKKSLKPEHYNFYSELRNLFKHSFFEKRMNCYKVMEKFKHIKNKYYRKTMIESLEACMNYGDDICFEISPRNVAVKNGNLILLDCFFIMSELQNSKKRN